MDENSFIKYMHPDENRSPLRRVDIYHVTQFAGLFVARYPVSQNVTAVIHLTLPCYV